MWKDIATKISNFIVPKAYAPTISRDKQIQSINNTTDNRQELNYYHNRDKVLSADTTPSSFVPKTVGYSNSISSAPTKMPAIGSKITPMPQPKGLSKTGGDIKGLIAQAFPEDPKTATAVAMQESSLRPTARNYIPSRGIDAIGLFQINLPAHMDQVPGATYEEKVKNLMNPIINLQVAKKIHQVQNWIPWEAYTSGAYRKYLQ